MRIDASNIPRLTEPSPNAEVITEMFSETSNIFGTVNDIMDLVESQHGPRKPIAAMVIMHVSNTLCHLAVKRMSDPEAPPMPRPVMQRLAVLSKACLEILESEGGFQLHVVRESEVTDVLSLFGAPPKGEA